MRITTLIVAAALVAACNGSGAPANPGGPGGPVPAPDFQLQDVNATSPTAGEFVSPRDEIGHVSAWYFGDAT
jgi:hypothetical protein